MDNFAIIKIIYVHVKNGYKVSVIYYSGYEWAREKWMVYAIQRPCKSTIFLKVIEC